MNLIDRLQQWYADQCDGDWEHGSGFSISPIDNPGWLIRLRLSEDRSYDPGLPDFRDERSATDWVHVNVRDATLQVAGGPLNLEEVLGRFLDLVAPVPEAVTPSGDGDAVSVSGCGLPDQGLG